MKTLFLLLGMLFVMAPASVYDFKLKNIDGQDFNLEKYHGKKLLIVNTASKCGFTPQYKELQQLADLYKDKVIVIGFPANNFGAIRLLRAQMPRDHRAGNSQNERENECETETTIHCSINPACQSATAQKSTRERSEFHREQKRVRSP